MSTSTGTTRIAGRSTAERRDYRLGFLRVLHSEWIKFTTLRSTWMLLATTVLLMVGIGLLGGWGIGSAVEAGQADAVQGPGGPGGPGSGGSEGLNAILHTMPVGGIDLGQLIIGSLGVLLMASEYSTGMIRSTMAAVPRRLPAYFAKGLVIAAVAAVVGIASSFATYFLLQPILTGYGLEFGLDVPQLVQSMLLSGVYLALASLIALGLGTLLRNSAGAIVALVALFLVVPPLLGLIRFDWVQDGILPYLPASAGHQMLMLEVAEGALNQTQGGLVMGAWAAALLALGALSLKTRDV